MLGNRPPAATPITVDSKDQKLSTSKKLSKEEQDKLNTQLFHLILKFEEQGIGFLAKQRALGVMSVKSGGTIVGGMFIGATYAMEDFIPRVLQPPIISQPSWSRENILKALEEAPQNAKIIKCQIFNCLENGADAKKDNLLLYTIGHPDQSVAELLLLNGANPNQQFSSADIACHSFKANWSFVDCVVERNWPSLVLLAVENGINPDQKIMHGEQAGQTVGQYLESCGYEKQLQRLKLERAAEEKQRVASAGTLSKTEPLPSDKKHELVGQPPNRTPAEIVLPRPNNVEINADKLTDALFLALFADIVQAAKPSSDSKENYKTSTLYKFIQLGFVGFPELTALARKLELEKTELKDSKQGKVFIEFTRHALFQAGATQIKVEPKQMTDVATRKKWYALLEKDEKRQAEFKEQTHRASQAYLISTDRNIILGNIADQVMTNLDLKKNVDAVKLKQWITQELHSHKRSHATDFEKNPAGLVKLLAEQITLSINDTNKLGTNRIKEPQQQPTYRLRIIASIWQWLSDTHQLTNDEKTLYELTGKIWVRLEQLRGHTKSSQKKSSIEYMLIFECLLNHPKTEDILLHVKTLDAKELQQLEFKLNIIEYIVKNKRALEISSNEQIKDDSHDGLSYDVNQQEKYITNIRKILVNWFVEITPREYSVSRAPALSISIASPDYKSPTGDVTTPLNSKQKRFITSFCREFEKYFCMYKALDDHMVSRLQESVDKIAKEAENYQHVKLNLMGVDLPLGQFGLMIAKLAVYRKDKQVENAARRMGWLFGSRMMEENAKYIRFAAEYIAHRHQMQIERLTEESISIEIAGECAADRAIQYITASDNNLVVSQPSLLDHMWEFFKQSVVGQKYRPILLPEFKGPVSAIIDGVIEGECEKDTKVSVSTESGETWAPGGIFRNVGFIIKDEKEHIQLYRHPNLVTLSDKNIDHKEHGALAYGYCWVRPEELELALKHGYVKDEKTLLSEVFKRFPKAAHQTAAAPQSPPANPMLPANRK